jgi:hypothetical protein
MEQLLAKVVINPKAKTTNMGPPLEFIEVETLLFQWIEDLCNDDIPIQTREVILQAFVIARDYQLAFSEPGKYHS